MKRALAPEEGDLYRAAGKWITIFWCGLASEELDGIFTTSFPFLISAPSTDAIWLGFQTDNSYRVPALPANSKDSASADAGQESEITRRPRLELPNGGSEVT